MARRTEEASLPIDPGNNPPATRAAEEQHPNSARNGGSDQLRIFDLLGNSVTRGLAMAAPSMWAIDSGASTHILEAIPVGATSSWILPPSESWYLSTVRGPTHANHVSTVLPSRQVGYLEALDLPESQIALCLSGCSRWRTASPSTGRPSSSRR